MTRPMSEQAVLRLSIAMTFVVAAVGIGFGMASGSASIIFDGIYSLTDAVMTSVALLVSSCAPTIGARQPATSDIG